MPKSPSSFTLIELLVVIAIIATLAVLVFVALNPNKRFKDARDSRRRSDVETILAAIHSSVVDNRGSYPTNMAANGTEAQLGTNATGCLSCGTQGYLTLPGTSGNYVSAPDSPELSITGDLDMRIAVAMNDWTPSAEQALIGKRNTSGNQRSYYLATATSSRPRLYLSFDGTTEVNKIATSNAPVGDGAMLLVKATLDVDNGAGGYDVKFYTKFSTEVDANTNLLDDTGWTQLGTTVTTATPTTIYDGTALLNIGSQSNGSSLLAGKVYAVVIKNGIDGTLVFNADFTTKVSGSNTFTESSVYAATVTLVGSGAQAGDGRTGTASCSNLMSGAQNLTPYLKTMPIDPSGGTYNANITGYAALRDLNGIITVRSCGRENETSINASR